MADIARVDLDNRIGARAVSRMFDDDGDGVADPTPLDAILDEATAYARSLISTFTKEQLDELAQDPRYIGAVADIAIGLGSERRAEFLGSDQKPPYSWRLARGIDTVKAIATGAVRLSKETTVGANPLVGGTVYDDGKKIIGTNGTGDF